MSSSKRIRHSLDGLWILAAEESLLDQVERNETPQTPSPGSPPPTELLSLLSAPGSSGSSQPSFRESGSGRSVEADLSVAVPGYRALEVTVPTVWERDLLPKPFEGPAWFLRSFGADEIPDGRRVHLVFDAVSYVCTVWLNGTRLGDHRGMWDSFSFDITDIAEHQNFLAVEVYKPWKLFPVRESLAGFIPYVTTTFGGIWQSVYLEDRCKIELRNVFAQLSAVGAEIAISGEVRYRGSDRGDQIEVSIGLPGTDEVLARVRTTSAQPVAEFSTTISASGFPRWSPASPELVTLEVVASDGAVSDALTIRTGLREIGTDERVITLNDVPVYPRGILHWLSYPELVAPVPDEEAIRHEVGEMQRLGFNMIKLCLVVPPERYFRIADEMGMMLWLELPMWLPQVDEAYRERARQEYRQILRAVRNHPSIVMYTLGCELSSEADAPFLRELYDMVKEETGSPLVRDNSGSAECYGGVDLEFADYHDYHFYAEAVEFTNLLDYFVPAWKPVKPLVFGEYCDSDTFRSVAAVKAESGHDPYWSHDDPVINPQGVRWDYNVVTNEPRLANLDLGIPFDEITRRSHRKSFEYRKWIVEQTRVHAVTSGYVITNIQNTPITTSGMLDDFGRQKFDVERFREFNSPTVIAVERDRRRIWQRGADRPQHLDPHVFRSGEEFRVNAIVVHHGEPADHAALRWTLRTQPSGAAAESTGSASGTIADGEERFTGLGTLPMLAGNPTANLPETERPRRLEFRSELFVESKRIATNTHSFWIVPDLSVDWSRVGLFDDRGLFASERGIGDASDPDSRSYDVLLATADGPVVQAALEAGIPVVLLLDSTTSALTSELPFFREAIPLVHKHPVVDDLPHDGYACAHWAGVTPDRAIVPDGLLRAHGGSATPIISRLDARTSLVSHYLCELQTRKTSLLATTLALGGSFGRTPQGLRYNVLGRYLLATMLGYLSEKTD